MARVNVETKALTDPRFELLGRLLGSSRHDALGRMVRVWAECQERGSYTLPRRILDVLMDHADGAALIVDAELGEYADDEEVRIRGTKGRIEWLEAKRKTAKSNGLKGGRPRKRPETYVGSASVRSGFPAETPPAPAPAPAHQRSMTSDCSEPARTPASEPAAVLMFSTVGAAREWGLTQEKLEEYQAAFPSMDVLAECRKASQWCRDNPARRKTPVGMTRFLGQWLGRANDQGGSHNGNRTGGGGGGVRPPARIEPQSLEEYRGKTVIVAGAAAQAAARPEREVPPG